MKNIALVLVTVLILTSCQKDEIPVAAHERGPVESAQVTLGAGYPNQIFYSILTHSASGSNTLTDWDMAFEGGDSGWRVVLNDSRMMAAWKSGYNQLNEAVDSTGFAQGKKTEICATRYIDPAMGDWRNENPVYLIDLGYGLNGLPLGLYWLQITGMNSEAYTLSFRPYGSSEDTEASIIRSENTSYARFSLTANQQIPTPADADWEIQFSKYAYRFIDPPQDYLVTGVLINPARVVSAEILSKDFNEITASDTLGVNWSAQPDVIGYDWKYYDFGTATYEVDATRTWIIRTREGYCFKLRFTDYYDEQGNAGAPQFECAEL